MTIWAVVPAAGVGRRMGADVPKQYLRLAGKTVLEHTLDRLVDHPRIAGVVVAVAAADRQFATLPVAGRVTRAEGGDQRADSVLSALRQIPEAGPADWVLVHDAVRPCLASTDLDRLIDSVLAAGCGGLLAVPVRDTMKRVNGARVTSTVPRDGLWHALTPQMFPIVALRDALLAARVDGANSTDEAEAMERQGYQPLVVEGRADNIKITRPDDLEHAALFLRHSSSPGIELQGPVPE
jgi:2-C-methyl-D-erythritol 4-phosphate cytidylyltransferase